MNSHQVTVVIKTLPERNELLVRALNSLFVHVNYFSRVVLSVNGGTLSEDNLNLVQKLCHFVTTYVIYTHQRVDGPSHSRFVASFLEGKLKPLDLVLLLADDDTLCAGHSLCEYINLIMNSSCLSVGIDNSLLSLDSEFNAFAQGISWVSPGASLTPSKFLMLNHIYGHRFTSISGMILPYCVYKDASFFLHAFRSKGRRTEYVYLTHRSVQLIVSPSSPVVCVLQHPAQAGRTLSRESGIIDELIYYLWNWKQAGPINMLLRIENHQFSFLNLAKLVLSAMKMLLMLIGSRLLSSRTRSG